MSDNFAWKAQLEASAQFPLFVQFLTAARHALSAVIIGPDYVVMDKTSYENLKSWAEWNELPRVFDDAPPAPQHIACVDESAEIPSGVFLGLCPEDKIDANGVTSPLSTSNPHNAEKEMIRQTDGHAGIAEPGRRSHPPLSERGKEWVLFTSLVLEHIEGYTVPQYGDKPDDQISSWTVEQIMLAIRKRTHRAGKNSRGPAEDLRDCLKIAHEACVAYFKMKDITKDERKADHEAGNG